MPPAQDFFRAVTLCVSRRLDVIQMAEDLQKRGAGLYERRDTSFLRLFSENGQIQFWIKENPQGKIYHTILVERNGLVHQMLFNSKLEERDYVFWGSRCYGEYIR